MSRKSVLIRIPDELYDALAKWADDKLRSTNAQIEYLLQDAVKKAGRAKKPKEASKAKPAPVDDQPAKRGSDVAASDD